MNSIRILVAGGAMLACLAAATPLRAQPDSTWTLDRCLEAAFRSAPRLRASASSLRAAQASAHEASAGRWPVLGLSGTYSFTSETQQIEMGLPPAVKRIEFGDGNVYDVALNARVPLYSGGALREKARAEVFAQSAARWDCAGDSLQLAHEVRRAYFAALGSEARAQTARQSARRLERHLHELAAAESTGMASEENRIAALSRLRQAEQRVSSADAEARAAVLRLGELIGQPGIAITIDRDLEQPLAHEKVAPTSPDSRPMIAAMQAREDQARRYAKASRGALWPALSASAAYHYARPGVDVVTNEWMDYYVLGVNATWTLWDWRAREHRVAQNRATADAVSARKQDLVNRLTTSYETALTVLNAARDTRRLARERMELERRRLELVEGRLRAGMASESEYLDAQDDLAAAEIEYTSATAALRLAEADLLNAAGY